MTKKRIIAALLAYLLTVLPALATGPGTVTFPAGNSIPYKVTFDGSGFYSSTNALVDINNPANGATISGGSLQVTVQNTPTVTLSGTSTVILGAGSASVGTVVLGAGSAAVGTVTLGAGAATIGALSLHQSTNIDQVGGSALALGQTTMAASLPVAIASNQGNVPINNAQVSGTAIDTNSGTKSAGTQRVVLATDQPTLTNPINVGTHTATSFLYAPGTNGFTTAPFTVMSTDLNTWASTQTVISSVNGTSGKFSQASTGNSIFGRCWYINGTAVTTPTAGANISLWFLTSTDGGTTFEAAVAGTPGTPPPRSPDIVIPVATVTLTSGVIYMSPPRQNLWAETVKIVAQNNTGVALTGTGQSIVCGPQAAQG